MEKIGNKTGIWGWIKYGLGFYKNPPYVEDRLSEADVHSAQYLSFVVGCVEIWMIVRYTINYGDQCETIGEFLHYTYGYWIMLAASFLLLGYCIMYFRNMRDRLKKLSQLFILMYFLLGTWFGAMTAFSDFTRGRMIICFLSTLMYVTVIVIRRPFISLGLTIIPAVVFFYILNNKAYDKTGVQLSMTSGDTINYITFIISLVILEISVYFQRYREAWDSYNIEQSAVTDSLTGMPNMRRFEKDAKAYMEDSMEKGQYPMYLLFDVINFQTFNDRFDYSAGNKLLIEVGKIVMVEFPDEPCARSSSDHFAVLTNQQDFVQKAEHIRTKFKALYPNETYLDIKTGGYRAKATSKNPRHALDRASHALSKIHNHEDEFFKEYDEKMRQDLSVKQYVLNHVEEAVKEGYVRVYYQPVMWADGTLAGSEALARWIDPVMGFMSPGVFIPTLEEGRQIHKLDLCVYETVCKHIRYCLDNDLPVLPTSMNFSRLDFELMDAVGELEKLVEKYNIPKEYLHVEITESTLTHDVAGLKKAMKRLHESGYVIWLDDFGSGYSSMNVLKDFDFDLLKIDMEFLRNFNGNENSRKIIASVINLAKELGMETLAEGVETQEAVDFLREAGCGRLQGYFYGKPMPYEDILEKIQNGTYKLGTKEDK